MPEDMSRKTDHIGDANEMVPKPCAHCAGKGFVDIIHHDERFGYRYYGRVMCGECHATAGPTELSDTREEAEKKAIAAWNRRAPEPGASVIRWTRYDGTPETLPEGSYGVLLFRKGSRYASYYQVYDNVWRGLYKTNWLDGSHPEIGDLWAYLPEPPKEK